MKKRELLIIAKDFQKTMDLSPPPPLKGDVQELRLWITEALGEVMEGDVFSQETKKLFHEFYPTKEEISTCKIDMEKVTRVLPRVGVYLRGERPVKKLQSLF